MSIANSIWRGIAVAEGFDDPRAFEKMCIVTTKIEHLEGEEAVGTFHFHHVEVNDADVDQVATLVASVIKPSWFLHLVSASGENMKVIFRDNQFNIEKGDDQAMQEVIAYGKKNGIHEDQLQLHRLFDNPYDE